MIKQQVHCLYPYFILILFSFLPVHLSAQVTFDKGYYINNDNQKVDCYIKNLQWRKSPVKLEYKLTLEGETKEVSITEVSQFVVSNLKYERHTVLVDQSKKTVGNLSMQYAPEFEEKTLMLEKLIEGRASLYFDGNSLLYFYSVNNSKPEQLVYKDYIRDGKILKNKSYRLQLIKALSCEDITAVDIQNIAYVKRDLVKLFEIYNTSLNAQMVKYGLTNKGNRFNVFINAGARLAYVSFIREYSSTFSLGNSIGFTSDVQIEYVLPYNRNKWALFFNPTYQSYTTDCTYNYVDFSADYKSIELPLGVKYRMFINEDAKIFFEVSGFLIDIPFNSYIGSRDIENGGSNVFLGGGYEYKNFNVKVKYGTHPDILSEYVNYTADYQSFSFTVGYKLF